MFRLSNRVRIAASPSLMQSFACIRQLHQPAILPYNIKDGLAPFLSEPSLDLLYNVRQVELINNVNRLTEGTEYERKSLYDVIYQSSQDPSQTSLMRYASQAWNIDFFMQTMTKDPKPMREDVRRMLSSQFGSVERFKDVFKGSALAMFGSGWTWLVLNSNGTLSVMNTYNATTPFTAVQTSGSKYLKGTSYVSISKNIHHRPFITIVPILGLSMWQEAFIPDYALDRETYINNYWDVVNWSAVRERMLMNSSNRLSTN
ncbi:hypothetical protein IWW48_001293 [Coemansia sp. RSA 1200]|nr:hypothetical protein IWW48_001293 [Coemansia sp. RSA 1200]